jgi:hypothetical protein
MATIRSGWLRETTQRKKGYFFRRRLAANPPKPNTIPITSVLATRATRKTTRFSVRDAKYKAAGAMHRVAWALQDSKAIGQICEKPWENLWFLSGEDRNRTFGCFPNGFGEFERWLLETGILPKNPTGGRFAWTNSLSGQKCLFRLGPTQDPKIQVLPSWHLVLVSVAIPS